MDDWETLWTLQRIFPPYFVLSDAHSQYTDTNNTTRVYMIFYLLYTLIFITYFQVFNWKKCLTCAHAN